MPLLAIMERNKNMKLEENNDQGCRKKDLLCIAVIVLIIIAFFIVRYHFDPEHFKAFVFSWYCELMYLIMAILIVMYLAYPKGVRDFLIRWTNHKAEQTMGPGQIASQDSWKKDMIKKDLSIKKPISPQKVDHLIETPILKELSEDLEKGKFERVIAVATKKLEGVLPPNIEARVRVLLEFAYNERHNEKDYDARIQNLQILFRQKTIKIPLEIIVYYKRTLILLLINKGHTEEANSILNEMFYKMNLKGENPELYAQMNDLKASILLNNNRPHIALSYLKRALLYSKNDSQYEYKISNIYLHAIHAPWLALEYIREACFHLTPETCPFLERSIFAFHVYLEAFVGNFSKAYEIIEQMNTDDSYFLACQSYISFKLGKYQEAENLYRKVLEKQPKNETAINVKALLHLKNKEYETALECFKSVLEDFEKETDWNAQLYTAEIYYHMGICYIRTDRLQEASSAFKKAEELGFLDFDAQYLDKINQYMIEQDEIMQFK